MHAKSEPNETNIYVIILYKVTELSYIIIYYRLNELISDNFEYVLNSIYQTGIALPKKSKHLPFFPQYHVFSHPKKVKSHQIQIL